MELTRHVTFFSSNGIEHREVLSERTESAGPVFGMRKRRSRSFFHFCCLFSLALEFSLAPRHVDAGQTHTAATTPTCTQRISVVTGASSNHYQSLLQLLDSLDEELGRQPPSPSMPAGDVEIKVIVYDIGLSVSEKQDLDKLLPRLGIRAESRVFDFRAWPTHVHDLDCRAWKPIIFDEVLREADGAMGLDAGCLVSNGRLCLDALLSICLDGGEGGGGGGEQQQCSGNSGGGAGALLVASNGLSGPLTHPSTLHALNHSTEDYALAKKMQVAGGAVAMCRQSQAFDQLSRRWMECALDPSCICPSKKTRKDQAALTVLAHRAGYEWDVDSEDVGVLFHQDIDAKVEFACSFRSGGAQHGDLVDVEFKLRVICHEADEKEGRVCCVRGMRHVGAFGLSQTYIEPVNPHFKDKPEFMCNNQETVTMLVSYPKLAADEGDPVCHFSMIDARGKEVIDIKVAGEFET